MHNLGVSMSMHRAFVNLLSRIYYNNYPEPIIWQKYTWALQLTSQNLTKYLAGFSDRITWPTPIFESFYYGSQTRTVQIRKQFRSLQITDQFSNHPRNLYLAINQWEKYTKRHATDWKDKRIEREHSEMNKRRTNFGRNLEQTSQHRTEHRDI